MGGQCLSKCGAGGQQAIQGGNKQRGESRGQCLSKCGAGGQQALQGGNKQKGKSRGQCLAGASGNPEGNVETGSILK